MSDLRTYTGIVRTYDNEISVHTVTSTESPDEDGLRVVRRLIAKAAGIELFETGDVFGIFEGAPLEFRAPNVDVEAAAVVKAMLGIALPLDRLPIDVIRSADHIIARSEERTRESCRRNVAAYCAANSDDLAGANID